MAQDHVRIADGYSSHKLAVVMNTTPSGFEYGLVVRPIGATSGSPGGGTSSMFMGAFPPSGTAAGFTDGTNMQAAMVYDTDSNAGTEWTLGVNLRGSGPGGSVEIGTLAEPIYVKLAQTGTQSSPLFVEQASFENTYQHLTMPNMIIVLSSTPGTLVRVLVTNFGATGAKTTLYDNTSGSGTIIAQINTSAVIGELPFEISYDIGLTVVTDSKAPGDITIIYR